MKTKIFILSLFFMLSFISLVIADTVYLKNGRSIEGLIKKESDEKIELDVGFGTITLKMREIESIKRSSPDDLNRIYKEWEEREKLKKEKKELKHKESKDIKRRKKLELNPDHILVNALLNNKVKAQLLLDTGASTILLSNEIAKELDIAHSTKEKNNVRIQMADGRKVDAIRIVLDSVDVEGAKAENISALILSGGTEMDMYDGLLGMSFLNNFNFRIDTAEKKLILQKKSSSK